MPYVVSTLAIDITPWHKNCVQQAQKFRLDWALNTKRPWACNQSHIYIQITFLSVRLALTCNTDPHPRGKTHWVYITRISSATIFTGNIVLWLVLRWLLGPFWAQSALDRMIFQLASNVSRSIMQIQSIQVCQNTMPFPTRTLLKALARLLKEVLSCPDPQAEA